MADADVIHTILVVDDEILIRLNIADYLRECGYRVLEASTAAEAVDVLATNAVDLVFSDVQMPGDMDGFGLARWVRQHRPGVRMILTSGHVRAAEEAADLCEAGPIERKPYDHALLLERIRRVIGATQNGTRSCA